MPPWRQKRDTQELEQKSRQSFRSASMLALGQACTLRIMPSGLHTQGMLRQHTLLNNFLESARNLPPYEGMHHSYCQLLCTAVQIPRGSFGVAWYEGIRRALRKACST